MYGETCIDITGKDVTTIIKETAALGIKGAITDQMGMGYIVYWPKLTV
jgi:hypothetical protein